MLCIQNEISTCSWYMYCSCIHHTIRRRKRNNGKQISRSLGKTILPKYWLLKWTFHFSSHKYICMHSSPALQCSVYLSMYTFILQFFCLCRTIKGYDTAIKTNVFIYVKILCSQQKQLNEKQPAANNHCIIHHFSSSEGDSTLSKLDLTL